MTRLGQRSLCEDARSTRSPTYIAGPTVERVSPKQLYTFLTGHEPSPSSLPDYRPSTGDPIRAAKRLRLGEDSDSVSIWEERAEVCFLTCVAHIPPLERQKVMFFGKSCGRNEVIAMIVSLATGNLRHRKQVSSHAQVIKGRPGLHPYLASLFEAENHAPLEESSTVGNAVILRFPRVLYDFMGIPAETDLASARKPDWFVAAEQDISGQSKDSDKAHETESAKTLAVTSSPTKALRKSSPKRDEILRSQHRVRQPIGSTLQVEVGPGDPLTSSRAEATSLAYSGHCEEADDLPTSDHSTELSRQLLPRLSTPRDITIWSRCGGLPRCLADCAAKKPLSRGFSVDDIPLVRNRYKNIGDDLQAGSRVLHVEAALRLPRATSHRVTQFRGLIDLSVVVNLSASGEKAPVYKVVAAGGFSDQCLFREEVPVEGKKPISGSNPWQARAILNTRILNGIMTSPGLDVEDVLLPHVWLKQSITMLSPEAALPVSKTLSTDIPGNATVILIYTFMIGDGEIRISSL